MTRVHLLARSHQTRQSMAVAFEAPAKLEESQADRQEAAKANLFLAEQRLAGLPLLG